MLDNLMSVRAELIEYESAGLIDESDARELIQLIDDAIDRTVDIVEIVK